MAQFDVYRNHGNDSKTFPFIVDIQNDLLSNANTRVVVPLLCAKTARSRKMDFMERLNPVFIFGSTEVVCATHLLAAVHIKELREKVGSIAQLRSEVIASLDILFTGI